MGLVCQYCIDGFQQGFFVYWFGQVVVSVLVFVLDFVGFLVFGGDDDYWDSVGFGVFG